MNADQESGNRDTGRSGQRKNQNTPVMNVEGTDEVGSTTSQVIGKPKSHHGGTEMRRTAEVGKGKNLTADER